MKQYEATFIHEFIHYLQDLVLTYNIRYSLSNVRWFFDIIRSASKNKSINRPFKAWSRESSILRKQFFRGFGDDQIISLASKIGTATSKFVITSGYDGHLGEQRKHRVYEYILPVYECDKQSPILYRLGARDILEYIAYKIEYKNFPDELSVPQFPYKSIDLIFDKYGLKDVPDDVRICIAERCLYNDAPIHFLIYTLLGNDELKKYIVSSSYEEIYKFMLSLDTVTRDGKREALGVKRQRRLIQFIDELKSLYNGFDEIEKWILKVNSFVANKLSDKFIFSDLYKMSKDEMLKFVKEVISYVGIPLVINSKEKYISIQSNDTTISEFIQFYILQKFIRFVQTNEIRCPIYNFCKANGEICNGNCVINKDMIINGNENCYFRKFMENYGLLNIKILS